MAPEQSYQGIVQKIVKKGKHGPYAVVSVKDVGSVTFSLQKPVWEEEDWPEAGNVVLLQKLRKKRAGWRALFARFVTPQDSSISA